MPIIPGNFDKSALATVMVRSDRMWADDMLKIDFKAEADTYLALKKEQNADVSILQSSDKKRDVKVHWINDCANTVSDCAAEDCDLSGPELGSDDKSYALTQCKEYTFTVDEMKMRTNHFSMEEVIARGFMKGDKALSEAINQTGVSRIESFKGINAYAGDIGTLDVPSSETFINAADWNERTFAYFSLVSRMNKFSNGFLLSGTNMFIDRQVSLISRGNGEGKGSAHLYSMIRTYFDTFDIDTINSPNLKSYLINRGAVAFASRVDYNPTPTVYTGSGQTRFSMPSKNLPGVWFDVFMTDRCVGKNIKFDFKMIANYDYYLNPTGCDDEKTGILAFRNV